MQARPQIDVYAMLNTLGISREQFQNFNQHDRQLTLAKFMQQQQQMANMGINPQSLYQQDSQQQMMPPPVPRPPTAQGHHAHRSPTIPGSMGSMHDMQRPQSRMVCFFSLYTDDGFTLFFISSLNTTLPTCPMDSNNSTNVRPLRRANTLANQVAHKGSVTNKPSTYRNKIPTHPAQTPTPTSTWECPTWAA